MAMIATLYGVGAAGTVLLQARQIARRGSSCDVSARFFATYAGGYAIWLLYGLSIGSLPIILVHAVGLLRHADAGRDAPRAWLAPAAPHVDPVSRLAAV